MWEHQCEGVRWIVGDVVVSWRPDVCMGCHVLKSSTRIVEIRGFRIVGSDVVLLISRKDYEH